MQKTVWIKMKVMHSAAEYLITIIIMNQRVRETHAKATVLVAIVRVTLK